MRALWLPSILSSIWIDRHKQVIKKWVLNSQTKTMDEVDVSEIEESKEKHRSQPMRSHGEEMSILEEIGTLPYALFFAGLTFVAIFYYYFRILDLHF